MYREPAETEKKEPAPKELALAGVRVTWNRAPSLITTRPSIRGLAWMWQSSRRFGATSQRRVANVFPVEAVRHVRKNGYEAFARADTRIPLMYMPDGVRALLELAMADRAKLSRAMVMYDWSTRENPGEISSMRRRFRRTLSIQRSSVSATARARFT